MIAKRSIKRHLVLKYHNSRARKKILKVSRKKKQFTDRRSVIKVSPTAMLEPRRQLKVVSKNRYLQPRTLYPANDQTSVQVGKQVFLRPAWSYKMYHACTLRGSHLSSEEVMKTEEEGGIQEAEDGVQ